MHSPTDKATIDILEWNLMILVTLTPWYQKMQQTLSLMIFRTGARKEKLFI